MKCKGHLVREIFMDEKHTLRVSCSKESLLIYLKFSDTFELAFLLTSTSDLVVPSFESIFQLEQTPSLLIHNHLA